MFPIGVGEKSFYSFFPQRQKMQKHAAAAPFVGVASGVDMFAQYNRIVKLVQGGKCERVCVCLFVWHALKLVRSSLVPLPTVALANCASGLGTVSFRSRRSWRVSRYVPVQPHGR